MAATPPADFAGKRFGSLTVTAKAGKIGNSILWACVCDCGKKTTATTGKLRTGRKKSCGCLQRKRQAQTRLARTSDKQREVRELRSKGWQYKRIAEHLGISLHAAWQRAKYSRTQRRIRDGRTISPSWKLERCECGLYSRRHAREIDHKCNHAD